MHIEIIFVTLIAVATAVALIARWLKIPYTVALVLAGLIPGAAQAIHPPHLTKDLLYGVFLPGLIFEAAFHLNYQKFWRNKLTILTLAVPGVVAAIFFTTALLHPVTTVLHLVSGFTLTHALVFSALIVATDPIAVVALFKSLGAPKRLAFLLEGESLLNDGTAVVLFTLILGVVSGGKSSLGSAALDFIKVVGVGTVIGTAIGFGSSKLTQHVEDPMIEITLTTIAAYGSFTAAEHFGFSGIIATVAAGMVCGSYGARTFMSPTTRIAVESFWEYVAFALNSVVFLLIGFEIHIGALLHSWKPILAAYLAVTFGRAVLIYLVTLLLRRTRESIPWAWSAVMTWGGLRGGLSMVLVLCLPQDFAFRDLLVTITFGVVVLSILLQGLSMSFLLRRLGLVGNRTERTEYERERGVMRAKIAALSALDQMQKEGALHAELAAALKAEYSGAAADAEQRLQDVYQQVAELRAEEEYAARRHLLLAEKDALLAAHHTGQLGEKTLEYLMRDVDTRLQELESDKDKYT